MKVLIISTLFSFCATICCSAQVSFGVKLGGNVNGLLDRTSGSLVYSVNKEELNSGYGFHLGIYSRIGSRDLSFIPEIQYSKKNAGSYSYDLLEIPLMLNYKISKTVEIDGGVSVDYNFSNIPFDKKISFGGLVGLRFNISDRVSIISRYIYGITSMRDVEYTVVNPPANTTNLKSYWRTFQLGIGYKIK